MEPNGCLIWTRYRDSDGYGHVNQGGRRCQAHRVAWETCYDKIPDGLTVDHLCRNRSCVNPTHMELVSREENYRRGRWGNLNPGTCAKGHPFDMVISNGKRQKRACRSCRQEWSKQGRQRRRAAELDSGVGPAR